MSLDALLRMSEIPFKGDEDALDTADLQSLFHRLNNQLGIVLAHAELSQAKSASETQRDRAGQVVEATLESMGLVGAIRQRIGL